MCLYSEGMPTKKGSDLLVNIEERQVVLGFGWFWKIKGSFISWSGNSITYHEWILTSLYYDHNLSFCIVLYCSGGENCNLSIFIWAWYPQARNRFYMLLLSCSKASSFTMVLLSSTFRASWAWTLSTPPTMRLYRWRKSDFSTRDRNEK